MLISIVTASHHGHIATGGKVTVPPHAAVFTKPLLLMLVAKWTSGAASSPKVRYKMHSLLANGVWLARVHRELISEFALFFILVVLLLMRPTVEVFVKLHEYNFHTVTTDMLPGIIFIW